MPALQWSRRHRLLVRSMDRRSRVCSIHRVQDQIWEAAETKANIIEKCSLNIISAAPAVDALPRQEQRGLYESSLRPFLPTAWTNQDLLWFYSVCVLLCFLSLDLPEGAMSISTVYWLHQCLDRFAVCTEKVKEFLLFAFYCRLPYVRQWLGFLFLCVVYVALEIFTWPAWVPNWVLPWFSSSWVLSKKNIHMMDASVKVTDP